MFRPSPFSCVKRSRMGDSSAEENTGADRKHGLAKGNVLAAARLAGILGAKKTGELIPLCHPLSFSHCEVNFDFPKSNDRIRIAATARIAAQTGVEMEALTAATLAALTIYDMCKAVDKEMRITNVRLVLKTKK